MAFRFKRRFKTHSNSSVLTLLMSGSTGLDDGTVGDVYEHTFTAQGGVAPYQSFVALNGLPSGLTLSTNGDMNGTPSTTSISTFTVHVTDAVGSTARAGYRLQIISSGASGPLELSIQNSTGAPQGVVNSAYSLSINSTGGEAPYSSFVIQTGGLPTGLSLNEQTGAITGTPSTTGVSTFTIQVRDNVGSTASASFRLAVISSAAANDDGGNAYYNSLLGHPNIYRAWSMRSNSTVDTIVNTLTSSNWNYIWPNDPYPDPQDGIKLTKNPNASTQASESVLQQIRFPVGLSTGSLFVTWDFFYGTEFKTNIGGVKTWKHYQIIADDNSSGAPGNVFCEWRSGWKNASGSTALAVQNFRSYSMTTTATPIASFVPGMFEPDSYEPTGRSALAPSAYLTKGGIWTRYWAEIKMQQPSSAFTEWNADSTMALSSNAAVSSTRWYMVSAWMCDEVTDPQRILYRVPWRIRDPYFSKVLWELNTSAHPGGSSGQSGPLYGYGRNVAMLHNATIDDSDTAIFKRPV